MGIFDSLFKSETKDSNWPGQNLESVDQLEIIKSSSFKTPQLIFKHSTRCSISRFVLADFTAHFTYAETEFGTYSHQSTTGNKNKITADVDMEETRVSIGYNF